MAAWKTLLRERERETVQKREGQLLEHLSERMEGHLAQSPGGAWNKKHRQFAMVTGGHAKRVG